MKFRIAAVIAAAGLSSRMGSFKPLLPFGDRTAVEMVIGTYVDSRVSPILVVGGHRFPELEKVVGHTAATCTYNPNYLQEMFSSFKHGLGALPGDIQAVFAHPVDMPLISGEIIQRMIRAFEDQPGAVIYPRYHGQPGRPVLIPGDLLGPILASREKGGMRVVLQAYSDRFRFVEVNHPGILWDMDEREDYRRLIALHEATPR
jgi:molybdenum cofactor cytidylyltransferase